LMKKAGVTPRVDEVAPDSEIVRELVGERAELVAYAPAPTQQNGGGNRSGG
ncbi:MAG TPA: RNA helicase, partial [Kocuria sp.]|nr:RNA helicase [Kocuria sp.]